MCLSGTEPYYQRGHGNACKLFCRRRWFGLILIIAVLSFGLIIMRQSLSTPAPTKRDAFVDDALIEVYHDVLRTWYNLTDDERWYNGKMITLADTNDWARYMNEIRQNWILARHNPNQSYNLDHPEIKDPSMGQARVIREIFRDKKNGFFIECGAYDGETRSNTLVLERFHNWTGLLVEADPLNFSKMLRKNRKAFLSPTCLGVKPYPTTASFLMADNVGRLHEPNSTDNKQRNSPDVAYNGVHVQAQCFPFAHYLAALDVNVVDYFSLDIEGNEIEVLKTIPFDMLQIKTLSVEHAHVSKGRGYLIDFMETRGYYVYSFVERSDNLANDVIFVRRDDV